MADRHGDAPRSPLPSGTYSPSRGRRRQPPRFVSATSPAAQVPVPAASCRCSRRCSSQGRNTIPAPSSTSRCATCGGGFSGVHQWRVLGVHQGPEKRDPAYRSFAAREPPAFSFTHPISPMRREAPAALMSADSSPPETLWDGPGVGWERPGLGLRVPQGAAAPQQDVGGDPGSGQKGGDAGALWTPAWCVVTRHTVKLQ